MSETIFHTEPEPDRSGFTEVAPKVRRLVARNSSIMTYHGTNTYLIDTDMGRFILDPGPSEDEQHFAAILTALGPKPAGILVSHHHSDHFGAVPRLKAATGAPVLASHVFADDVFLPDVTLRDGDRVGPLTVLHTPGHASDHLCFARNDGLLFTADHIMTWSSSMVMRPDGDMTAYCQNLTRLIAREDQLYLPGHGPPLQDPIPFARRLLAARINRENLILETIRQGPVAVKDISRKLYAKSDARIAWAAERNAEAHLEKLRSEGRVDRRGDLWSSV